MKYLPLVALAATVTAAAHAAPAPPPASAAPAANPAAVQSAVAGNTAFAADLWSKLRGEKGNVFFSPASISAALAMTYAGAGSETAKQMAKTMHFDGIPDVHASQGALLARLSSSGPDVPQLAIANRLWSQNGMTLGAPFASTVKTNYGAGVELMDFVGASEPSRLTINGWVAGKTNDKIKDLIPAGAIDVDTRLVLTNAIWFKGKWANAFAKSATKDAPFATPSGSANVPTMHATIDARYGETKDAQIVELPYQSKDPSKSLSMVIVLPSAKSGIAALETTPSFDTWIASLGHARVNIALPRFKTTQTLDLGTTLQSMGMKAAFLPSADFKAINDKMPLYITKVLHKAFVDVNEEGTEAAAATAVIIATESASIPPPPKNFVADRPFVFFLRDTTTGAILFVGRINDPRV